MTKYVYRFGGGINDGGKGDKNLLGGKGANLDGMAAIGLPVPPGFTITTEMCTRYYEDGEIYPDSLNAEVAGGIAKAHRSGAVRHAAELREWWDEIAHGFADRILPLDLAAATLAGEMLDRARSGGVEPGFEDAAIAAIAQRAGLTVLTRNVRHFAPLGAAYLDPFRTLPG